MPSQLTLLTLLLGAFFVFNPFPTSVAQAETYSLEQIVAGMDSTSPVLATARADLARAHAVYTSSRAFPNPSLFGTQETLNDAENSIERVIGVRQNLGFLWSQSSRRGSAKASYDAEQAAYWETASALKLQVLTHAYEYDRLRQESSLLDSALVRVAQIGNATTARRKEGDIAPYDEQRFQLEQIQLQNRKQELNKDMLDKLSEMVNLTGISAGNLTNIELMIPPTSPFDSEDDAVSYALEHRQELSRSTMQLQAAQRALTQARFNQLPDFSVGVGNKMLEPGASGLYVEGELEIPLWNQRRSEKNASRAELALSEIKHKSAQITVEQEVRAAYQQLQLVERMQPPSEAMLDENATVNMSRGVRLYLEDEISSLELVDALRTGIDAQDAALRLRNSLAVARAEMRRVTGLEPLER